MNKPVCPKCHGRLHVVVEYVDGGSKIDVIKCTICGYRGLERDHVEARAVKSATRKVIPPVTLAAVKAEPATKAGSESMDNEIARQKPAGRVRQARGTLNTPPCADCGRPGFKQPSRGLCSTCWNKHKTAGTLGTFGVKGSERIKPVPAGKFGTPPCADCGRPGFKLISRGLCSACWKRNDKAGTLDGFPEKPKVKRADDVQPAVGRQRKPMMLTVVFAAPRDAVLFARLERHAEESRRDLVQHVLWLVEQGLERVGGLGRTGDNNATT